MWWWYQSIFTTGAQTRQWGGVSWWGVWQPLQLVWGNWHRETGSTAVTTHTYILSTGPTHSLEGKTNAAWKLKWQNSLAVILFCKCRGEIFGCQVNSQKLSNGILHAMSILKDFFLYFSISRVYLACCVPLVQCKQTAEGCARSLPYSEHSCPRLGQSSYMGILGTSLDQGRTQQ